MSWAAVWAWFEGLAVRLYGYYKSLPVARPSTVASPEHPAEAKREEVVQTIEESELWQAVQDRDRSGL